MNDYNSSGSGRNSAESAGFSAGTPVKRQKSPFGIVCAAFGFGVVMLLTNLAVSYLYSFLYVGFLEGQPEWALQLSEIVTYLALMLPGAVYLCLVFRENPVSVWKEPPGTPRLPFLFFPMALGIGYLTSILTDSMFGDFLDRFSQSASAETFPTTPAGILLYFVSICILPPFFEEFLYRGVLFKHLQPLGEGPAVFVSAFLFAIGHISLSQTLFALAVGVALGYARSRSGSVWYGVLIHFVVNLISFGVSYWAFVYSVPWMEQVLNLMYTLLINLAIAGMAVYFILRTIRRARERAAMQVPPPKQSNAKWIFMNPLIYICILIYVSLLILYYAV